MTSDPAAGRSAGFVSRLLAVAVHSVLITAASVGVSATTELVATMFAKLDVPTPLGVIAASPTSMLATGAYFVLSWTLAGQTVGMRVLALRVIGTDERPPSARRALARLLSALIGALRLFAGYLRIAPSVLRSITLFRCPGRTLGLARDEAERRRPTRSNRAPERSCEFLGTGMSSTSGGTP